MGLYINRCIIGLVIMLFKYEFMYFQETFYCVKYLFSRTNDEKGVLINPLVTDLL